MILETERLILRQMTQEDYPALCRMLQDPLCMYAYEHAFSDEEAQAWLDRQLKRYREDGFGLWAMVRKDTGEMIGQCGLTWQDAGGERVLEVGYLLQRAHWHHGYATEAAVACRDYAFNVLHAPEVYSIIRDTNAASQAAFSVASTNTPPVAASSRWHNSASGKIARARLRAVSAPMPSESTSTGRPWGFSTASSPFSCPSTRMEKSQSPYSNSSSPGCSRNSPSRRRPFTFTSRFFKSARTFKRG